MRNNNPNDIILVSHANSNLYNTDNLMNITGPATASQE
jgi:hypothetical protein